MSDISRSHSDEYKDGRQPSGMLYRVETHWRFIGVYSFYCHGDWHETSLYFYETRRLNIPEGIQILPLKTSP
jgi:hypothetical protein